MERMQIILPSRQILLLSLTEEKPTTSLTSTNLRHTMD